MSLMEKASAPGPVFVPGSVSKGKLKIEIYAISNGLLGLGDESYAIRADEMAESYVGLKATCTRDGLADWMVHFQEAAKARQLTFEFENHTGLTNQELGLEQKIPA